MEPMQATDDDVLSHDKALEDLANDAIADDAMADDAVANDAVANEDAREDADDGGRIGADEMEEVEDMDDIDMPSSQESASGNRARSIAAVRIPDSISDAGRFPLRLDRYFHPAGLLVPNPEHLKSIESQSKSFGMVQPQDHPIHAGVSWSFVDYCTAPGLSQEMLKVLYFFATLNGLAGNHSWNGYVVPTEEIECTKNVKLKPLYAPNKKDIKGVLLEENVEKEELQQHLGSVMDDILLADDRHELVEGDVHTSVPFFSINVGFTSCVFKKDSKDDVALFGIVTVTSLMNVNTLDMMLVFPSNLLVRSYLTTPHRSASWHHLPYPPKDSKKATRGSLSSRNDWSTSSSTRQQR